MSQQRQLEVLRQRKQAGERPVVKVGDVEHEFGGVVWGGASPTVMLVDPAGVTVTKAAAAWVRQGAVFRGRSRDLAKAARVGGGLAKTVRQLEEEIDAAMRGGGG